MKVGIEMQTKEEAIEVLRKKLVGASRVNKKLIINIDKLVPDFKGEFTSTAENFDSNLVFDRATWKDTDAHKKIVREDENYDHMI